MLKLNFKKLILVLIVAAAVGVTFTSYYGIELRQFEVKAHDKKTQVNRYIELSRTFIELMTIYGNEYFQQSKNIETELYSLLKYEPRTDSFSMDMAQGTKYEKSAGNLTGLGRIPVKGINRDELNLALRYNEFFSNFYERLEGVEWLYYTSENEFVNIYPWVPSKDFEYFKGIKNLDFYRMVDPQHNPHRRPLWVPIYVDHAGKGLVVTLSSPIYSSGSFMGVISLDISSKKLSEIIGTEYESYLVDMKDSVITTGSGTTSGNIPVSFLSILSEKNIRPETVLGIKEDIIYRSGRYYIHASSFDRVPWRLYLMVPVSGIAYRASLASLPIFLIGIFLIFAVNAFDKSQKTGRLLQNSLMELKSYQHLLENAAKMDMLTATLNRRGLKENFKCMIDKLGTERPVISFVIGDIDHFKQFNDTFGHAAGDKVLIAITETIRRNVGSDDMICRWGGEEFVMALIGKGFEAAMAVAENVRKDVEALSISWEKDTILKGTMTFGVVEYNYKDSIDECIAKADSALYYGKEHGKNQVNGCRDDAYIVNH